MTKISLNTMENALNRDEMRMINGGTMDGCFDECMVESDCDSSCSVCHKDPADPDGSGNCGN